MRIGKSGRGRVWAGTPVGIRVGAIAVLVAATAWLLHGHLDRRANERRLAPIASAIAGRPVSIHCPGVLGRLFAYDLVEGAVRFDANGNPADVADLRSGACAELDALAEGRRTAQLRCVERTPDCGDDARAVAMAVDTLAHESFHLSGIVDEGQTECHALNRDAWTAQQLGATPAQAQALADLVRNRIDPEMPLAYRTACQVGPASGR